ncbi:MAG: hypothetical protein M3N59_01575 [bacterium]|nr:hypothetical protein [bacterium]
MDPNHKHAQPSFDFDAEDQEGLPLGDVLHNADEMAEHEEIEEELGL